MRPRTLLASVLFLGACATAGQPEAQPGAAHDAPTFAIRLHHPARIGDRHEQTSTLNARQTLVVKSGDTVLHEHREELRLELRTGVEVLDITDNGTALSTRYRVESFTQTTPDGLQTIVAPGTVVVVTRGAEAPFNIIEGQITNEAEEYLSLLLPTHAPQSTDDEMLGTDQPQPVGGAWSIDAQRAAKELATAGLRIPVEALTGEGRLVGVSAVEGADYLEIRAELNASTVLPPRLPAGATLRSSTLTSSFSGLFPTDAQRERLQDSAEITAETIFDQTLDGKPVVSHMRLEQQSRTSYATAANPS